MMTKIWEKMYSLKKNLIFLFDHSQPTLQKVKEKGGDEVIPLEFNLPNLS